MILIVEDNRLNSDLARDALELAGFEILQAEDAEMGIRMAKEHRPDLILMDMHLPVMNGYKATELLKADEETKDIVIVAFTASAMEGEKRRALAHGCDGVINKPISVDSFAKTVASYINNGSAVSPTA